jgi:uncharacterized membrane protein HdeD (DUF308 family)
MDTKTLASKLWWLLLVAGIIALAAGIAALVWPNVTLGVIALIFGIYLLISGLIELVAGIAEDEADSGTRVLAALLGVLSLIAGVIVLRHPGQSLLLVAMVLGIYLILAGVLTIYRAVHATTGKGMAIAIGIIDVIAGIIIAAWPKIGLTTLVVFVGVVLILRGIVAIWAAFQVKKLRDADVVVVEAL